MICKQCGQEVSGVGKVMAVKVEKKGKVVYNFYKIKPKLWMVDIFVNGKTETLNVPRISNPVGTLTELRKYCADWKRWNKFLIKGVK